MLQISHWNNSGSELYARLRGTVGEKAVAACVTPVWNRPSEQQGGVASLARAIGIAQPSVSAWSRIPAERVLAVEALTRVHRFILRPDLYGAPVDQVSAKSE